MAVTDSIQCSCSSGQSVTFGDIRQRVFAALGFVDPSRVTDVRDLESLRGQLYRMIGYASAGGVYPPGMAELLADWINSAQQQLWRRMGETGQAPARLVANDDVAQYDGEAILSLAVFYAKAHAGATDAKAWQDAAERNIRLPAGARAAVDQHIRSANELIYRRYDALHLRYFFSWQFAAGVSRYCLADNDEATDNPPQNDKRLDAYRVLSATVETDGGARYELGHGSPRYARQDMTGRPTHFELTGCIRVWPTPEDADSAAILECYCEPQGFTDDADYPSVDAELLYLLATANAKSQFGQNDAQLYVQQFESHLGRLTSGTHGTRRYVPGGYRSADMVYVAPKPEVPFP